MDTQSLFSQILEEEDLRGSHSSRFERFFVIKDLLNDSEKKLRRAKELFLQEMERMELPELDIKKEETVEVRNTRTFQEQKDLFLGQKILEGIFDGQHMIGTDGKQYHVPVNYASKSKLVEGDTLKLTISGQGDFLYKQIAPIERIRVIAVLDYNSETREYNAKAQDRIWKVLTASVTYFKGISGDEIVLITPKNRMSTWAAVENIIKKDLL